MKITKDYLKQAIQEILRLNKDGETEEFGRLEDIDAIYHDSTKEYDSNGHIKKTPLKIKLYKKVGDDIEAQEVY